MRTYYLTDEAQVIGRAGERCAVTVSVDVAAWQQQYPLGFGGLLVTCPDRRKVPLSVTMKGSQMQAVLPPEVLARPGRYIYEANWIQAGTVLVSHQYNCLVLSTAFDRGVPHCGPCTPEWAQEIYIKAEQVLGAVDAALEAEAQALGKPQEYVTPEDFGAADDEDINVDDAPFIRSAIASGKPIMLRRRYYIRSEIVAATRFAMGSPFEKPWNNIGFTFTNGGRFVINAEYAVFDNLYFYGYNEDDQNQYVTTAFVINGPDGLNGDAEFSDCIFSGLQHAIRANARGLRVDGCLFARCQYAIELNFVGTTADDTVTTSKKWGGRNFIIRNCNFHAGVSYTVSVIAGSSVYGLLYEGNVSDVGGAGLYVAGAMRDSVISGNIFNFSSEGTLALTATAGSALGDVLFSGNICHSVAPSNRYIDIRSENIWNMAIDNNVFDTTGYDGVAFYGEGTLNIGNLSISHNSFNKPAQKDDNASWAPIVLPHAFGGALVVGNRFSNLPDNVYCIRQAYIADDPESSTGLYCIDNINDGTGAGMFHPRVETYATAPVLNALGLSLMTAISSETIAAGGQLDVDFSELEGYWPVGATYEPSASSTGTLIIGNPQIKNGGGIRVSILNASGSSATADGTLAVNFIVGQTMRTMTE